MDSQVCLYTSLSVSEPQFNTLGKCSRGKERLCIFLKDDLVPASYEKELKVAKHMYLPTHLIANLQISLLSFDCDLTPAWAKGTH